MQNEPVRVVAAIQAALIAVWGVIIIAAEVDDKLAGSVTIAIGAVVSAVSAVVVRQRVAALPPPAPSVDRGVVRGDTLVTILVLLAIIVLVAVLFGWITV